MSTVVNKRNSKQPKNLVKLISNDLSRYLNLSKASAESLASRLREHNLLATRTAFIGTTIKIWSL